MDLLQTVRKEGSRGGRADFKWEDVKNDAHRENYLGHSLMAPVGRWQRGRDLSWYAKGGDDDSQKTEAEKRAEELRKVKEAEEDAMAKALGLPPPDRSNANLVPLGEKSTLEGPDTPKVHAIEDGDRDRSGGTRGRERRPHKESGRRRSRSPDGSRKKEHRRRDRSASRHRHHRRRRSRSRSGDRRKHRHRSRSRDDGYTRRRTEDYSRRRSRSRDRSPRRRQSEGSYHRT